MNRFALGLITASLVACGGGGGDGDPSGSAIPEGSWQGTLRSGSTVADLDLVVLENGTYFAIYSIGGSALGVVQGSGTASGGRFTSANGRDYAFGEGSWQAFSLTADFVPKTSISGSATAATTFSATYDATYETPVTPADVAGTYTGSAGSLGGVSDFALAVASNGTFTGQTSLGCRVSGTLTTRAAGKAVLDMTLTFDAATCGSSATARGIAGKAGGSGIVFAAVLPDRSDAVYGVGIR